jgi:hypothetical protein
VSVEAYSVRHLPLPSVTLGRYRLWHVSEVDAALERRGRRGHLAKGRTAIAESVEVSG